MKLTAEAIRSLVETYLQRYPQERGGLELFMYQLDNDDDLANRKTLPGHMTGCALVVSPDKTKLLLIYHKLFDMWLQPGGHWDPEDPDPLQAGRREAEEETAVVIDRYLPIDPSDRLLPIHIESHPIPARPDKQERPHLHHDFTYAFLAASDVLEHQASEVAAAGWFAFDAPECAHVRKRLDKLLASGLLSATP